MFIVDALKYMYMFNVMLFYNRYELTWPGQKLKLTPEGGVVGPK